MPVDADLYPVNLVVAGRRVLVVGGGAIAARKVEGLLACGADVHVVAIEVGEAIEGLAAAGRIGLERRAYVEADLDGTWLAVTATDDPATNRAVFEAADARRLWVNAADDPASCSVTLPAVVRRGPITVAIGTGGRSPALASWLRRHVDAELGPEYEVLAALLSEMRQEIRASGRSTEDLDWLTVIDGGMISLIQEGSLDLARERLQAWLSSSSD